MTNDSASFVIRPWSLIRISGFLILIACAAVSSGCNVIGFAAATVAGTTYAPAVYTLPKASTVVIAENFRDAAASVQDEEPLARYVTDLLHQDDVVPTIDPAEIYVMGHDSAASQKKWRGLSIAAMGRSVTAQQVIYLNILMVQIERTPGSEALRAHGEVTVRVVDSESAQTLWPVDAADGYIVTADTRMFHEGEDEADIRTALHKALAEKVTRLFTGYRTD